MANILIAGPLQVHCVSNTAIKKTRKSQLFSQLFPYTGTAAPCTTAARSLHKNKITCAISSGFGHAAKSAFGIACRFTAVSMMLGRIEFTLTPVPFTSAASESIIATAAAFDAAYADAPAP